MLRRRGRGEQQQSGPSRYQMRQKLVSIGDDYFIQNEQGQRVFKVDGKALRVRDTLLFEDMQGHELAKIKEKMLRVKDTMDIEHDGKVVATVKKALIAPLRERYTLNIQGGPDLDIQGNLVDHEYRIDRGRERVAEVSKKWFRVADSYGVEITPGEDDVLILAATAALDMMSSPGR